MLFGLLLDIANFLGDGLERVLVVGVLGLQLCRYALVTEISGCYLRSRVPCCFFAESAFSDMMV